MKKGLITKSAFKKLSLDHPWLAANDIIERSALPSRPCAFQFAEHWWFHSPESFLRLRRLGPAQSAWMKAPRLTSLTNADHFHAYFGDWMLLHFKNLLSKKIQLLDLGNEDLCLRWVFSENDEVPGLIVDIFGDIVVAQINSAPIEIFWLHIKNYLERAYLDVTNKNSRIFELRNSGVRKKEGLEIIASEFEPDSFPMRWNKFLWHMTPAGSQKTGAYFDQRENHRRTAELAKELSLKTAWDLCSYQGGFSLHLLAAGLTVTAVDQSEEALTYAQKNVELNTLPSQNFTTERSDIFTWLKQQKEHKNKVDLIVLDPPSFVKSRREINSALRAYKELNTLALQCLNPGGLLISCVCSHHVSPKLYESVLKDSSAMAKKKISVLEQRGPSPDHAPAAGFPEGRYLQVWYLRTKAE